MVDFDIEDGYEVGGSALPKKRRFGDLFPYVVLIGVFLSNWLDDYINFMSVFGSLGDLWFNFVG